MDKAQQAYLKGVAHSIEVQASIILNAVQALQRNDLLSMPVDLIPANFREIGLSCGCIQHILDEILPNVPEHEFFEGETVRLRDTAITGEIVGINFDGDSQLLYSVKMPEYAVKEGYEPVETVSKNQLCMLEYPYTE